MLTEWRRVVLQDMDLPEALEDGLQGMRLDEQQLRQDGCAFSEWLLGEALVRGSGGLQKRDAVEAYKCFCRGAELGSPLCLFRKGYMNANHQIPERLYDPAGRLMMVRAAEMGCKAAYSYAGTAYSLGYVVERNPLLSCLYYLRAGEPERVEHFLQLNDASQCIPYGVWEPQYHMLVPRRMREEMFTTLLLFKRLGISRYVALLTVTYICTR